MVSPGDMADDDKLTARATEFLGKLSDEDKRGIQDLHNLSLSMGLPAARATFTMMVEAAGIRRPGAAALDLAYVAAGYCDGFWEVGLNPWDVAAGSLLIVEAGGLVGDLGGDAGYLYGGQIIAANPRVFAQMVKLLSPYRDSIKSPLVAET